MELHKNFDGSTGVICRVVGKLLAEMPGEASVNTLRYIVETRDTYQSIREKRSLSPSEKEAVLALNDIMSWFAESVLEKHSIKPEGG